MDKHQVKLFLPKFKITWGTFDIGEKLADLGMPLAFTPLKADFSRINGIEPPQLESLNISSLYHKARVEVDEEGTKAAAGTAAAAVVGSSLKFSKPKPVPVFRADHPFFFAIRDRRTGAFLFLGRVADPTLN